jgi:integrase/recombinase XerD
MATVNVVLFTSKVYKNGSSPIMIRVTKKGQLKYSKIGDEKFNVFEKQWDKEFCLLKRDKRLNSEYEKQNAFINKKKAEAIKIISDFEEKRIPWTLFMFEERFKNEFRTENVSQFIEKRIHYLKSNERFNSAGGLEGTLSLLKESNSNFEKLHFPDINIVFIEEFEKYLRTKRKYKSTSIGIVLRGVRGILNDAISQSVGCPESYPFSNIYGAKKVYKISKLVDRNTRKRFIPKEFLVKMYNADFEEHHLNWAKNLFLFSFFSSGINFKDMSSLKKENIKKRLVEDIKKSLSEDKKEVLNDDINKILSEDKKEITYIEFFRSKTKAKIEIPITPKVLELLDWFDVNYKLNKNYLLPIINNHKLKGEKLNNHIISRRKRFNLHLKTIAERLGFPESINDISSYFARHSYATSMLRNGISVEKISQALGHSDIKTTQTYLGGFDRNDISVANDSLLD